MHGFLTTGNVAFTGLGTLPPTVLLWWCYYFVLGRGWDGWPDDGIRVDVAVTKRGDW